MNLNNLNSINIIKLPFFEEDRGDLTVIEELNQCPFSIARAFSVRAPLNTVRGKHAHKECDQLLVCLNGEVEVTCDDGEKTKKYLLDNPSKGLYVPKSIWQIQKYTKEKSVLLFLCNLPYNVNEYITNYDDFLIYRSHN